MTWLTPFMQHQRNVPVGANADIKSTDHEIVRRAVVEVSELIAGDAVVLMVPALHKPANRALYEAGKVAEDEPGVLAGKFDFAIKGEVVAAKHGRSCHNACGECFVVAVAQAEHPAVVLIVLTTLDFHEAEVAHAVVCEAVGLGADTQAVAAEGKLHLFHQFDVRNGAPAFRGIRSGDGDDFLPFSGTSAAVEDEVGMGTLDEGGGFWFEMSNHNIIMELD